MRLVTFTTDNLEPHVGVVQDKQVIDLTAWLGQQAWNNQSTPLTMLELISLGDEGLSLVREALKAKPKDLEQASALASLSLDGLLAPIPRPPKNVICMGRNYFEHAVESTRAFGEAPPTVPDYPMVFTKATTAINEPYGDIPVQLRGEHIDRLGMRAGISDRQNRQEYQPGPGDELRFRLHSTQRCYRTRHSAEAWQPVLPG